MEEQKQYDNILQEQEHVEVVDFLPSLKWQEADITDKWLDLTEDYVRPQYTISYKGVPFAPIGGIHALTGQAGHGKTAFFTMLMVAIIKGEYCGLRYELSRDIPHPKVLYIDTEMEKGNTQLVVKRLYKMLGWTKNTEQDQFRVLRLREEDDAEMRWAMTIKAIYETQPTIVFLDGFIDVLYDFNDNKECQTRIYQDMKVASFFKLSFWNLLHQNPGSTKMVGHSGSFLERKTTDVFMVTKNKEGGVVSFDFKQLKARGRDIEEGQYLFKDDEEHLGIPYIDEKYDPNENQPAQKTNEPKEPTIDEIKTTIRCIGTDTLSYFTLRERIKETFGIGSTKAKDYIMRACNLGLLTISDNKYTANVPNLFDKPEDIPPF